MLRNTYARGGRTSGVIQAKSLTLYYFYAIVVHESDAEQRAGSTPHLDLQRRSLQLHMEGADMLIIIANTTLAIIFTIAVIMVMILFARLTRTPIDIDDVPDEYKPVWRKTNAYAKVIAQNFKAIRFGIPAIIFTLIFSIGLVSPVTTFVLSFIMAIIITGLYIGAYFRIIPVEDENGQPNVALPVIIGERLPHVLSPGPFLSMPGMSLILYQASVINLDLKVEGVRTRLNSIVEEHENGLVAMANALRSVKVGTPKSGGEVDVDVSISIEVKTDNPWSLIGLDQAGDLKGAQNIFKDAVAEDVRQMGRHVTWLEFELATDLASAKLIRDLTEKKGLGENEDILIDPTEEKIREYLTQAQINGFPDAKGLSLKVRRVNITKVKGRGKLIEAAERAAIEQLKRLGLVENAKAMVEAIKEIRGGLTDGSLTEREIYDRVQLDEDGSRVSKTINQIDLGDPEKVGKALAAAIAAIAAIAGRNNT